MMDNFYVTDYTLEIANHFERKYRISVRSQAEIEGSPHRLTIP